MAVVKPEVCQISSVQNLVFSIGVLMIFFFRLMQLSNIRLKKIDLFILGSFEILPHIKHVLKIYV